MGSIGIMCQNYMKKKNFLLKSTAVAIYYK